MQIAKSTFLTLNCEKGGRVGHLTSFVKLSETSAVSEAGVIRFGV